MLFFKTESEFGKLCRPRQVCPCTDAEQQEDDHRQSAAKINLKKYICAKNTDKFKDLFEKTNNIKQKPTHILKDKQTTLHNLYTHENIHFKNKIKRTTVTTIFKKQNQSNKQN
jgi:hypothetical protein